MELFCTVAGGWGGVGDIRMVGLLGSWTCHSLLRQIAGEELEQIFFQTPKELREQGLHFTLSQKQFL